MLIRQFFVLYHDSTIYDIKQGYNRVISDSSEEDRWNIYVQKIEDIESLTDLENRTTDLYDPKFCYPDNDVASHVIGGYVQMKNEIVYSQCLISIVHLLMKGLINWKCIYNQERQSPTHFHRCKRISYFLQNNYLEKEQYYIPHEKEGFM